MAFTHFTQAERAVHYPPDRRFFLGIKPYMVVIIGMVVIGAIAAAWIQYLASGLPPDPSASFPPVTAGEPTGFPAWVSVSHWVNFLFLSLIIRSGLSILVD